MGTVHLKLLATELLNEAIPIRVYEDRDRFELARIEIPETVYCYRNWFDFTIRRQLTGPDATPNHEEDVITNLAMVESLFLTKISD